MGNDLGLGERKRSRKRGSAVAVRAYNDHIALRLTYYEAELLGALFDKLGMHHDGTGPDHEHNPIDQWESKQDRMALRRVVAKVGTAAALDQLEIRRANMVKRIDKIQRKVDAAHGRGEDPDPDDVGTINYLEGRLTCEDFLASGLLVEKVKRDE